MAESPLLRLEGITKDYYGATVLTGVNFALNRGEILGLVGENGAGKTTLMHILFGMTDIIETGGYSGNIYIEGEKVAFKSPFEALDAGIGMVHQEFSLLPGFTAYENIMLNRELTAGNPMVELFGERLATLKRQEMREKAEKTIAKLGVNISADTVIKEMPVAHKQFTEIAREISRDQV
ncbi:MAG: ATP-binding cassette domain-containing protein, partial [Treponema sp.]|nr:ATP-binding cassette domain-containing protein [Treponema sp.]